MKIFCERLKALRKDKKINSIDLGKIINVSGTTITRWENGDMQPTIENLYKLAKYFNVSSDYLLGLSDF